MSILDIIVLAVAALAAWTGWRSGGLHTVVGIVGRVAGVAIGLGLADWVAGATWAFPVRVISEIVLVLLGWAVGGRLAQWVSPSTHRPGGRISTVDRALGLGVRAVLTLVVGCLGIQAVSMWGPVGAQAEAADSALPGLVAQVGPVGLPRLGQLASDGRDALPADLHGLLPQTAAVNDHPAVVSSAVSQAVVQVTAAHSGSTTIATGTGFFVKAGAVVTAEHVVNGASAITITHGGHRQSASVRIDDEQNDLAILTVAGPTTAGLTVSAQHAHPGQQAVFIGYPNGGPQQVGVATVAGGVAMPSPGLSTGHPYLRPGYRLQSEVRPDNSGGPLLDTSGAVIGLIDARSLIDGDIGYAITAEPLLADLAR